MKNTYIILFSTIVACSQSPQALNIETVYQTSNFGFSQATKHKDFIFTSGQVGWDTSYKLIDSADFELQAKVAFENVEKILKSTQSDLRHVIHLRIYVVNLDIYERGVISKFLKTHYSGEYQPATTLLGISALARPNLRIEIEAIATTINIRP